MSNPYLKWIEGTGIGYFASPASEDTAQIKEDVVDLRPPEQISSSKIELSPPEMYPRPKAKVSMDKIKNAIIDLVNEMPGSKATVIVTELVSRFAEECEETSFLPSWEDMNVFDQLVQEGKLIEVEYCLPTMSYRLKSIYFPAGTTLKIIQQYKG